MAETASGWLKPRDLSKRGVAHRALQLLGDFLDEDQRAQAERHGGFAETSKDRVFWIPLEGTPWCAFADDGRVEHFCIAPDKRGAMPEGDVSLTYLLWIRSDPDGFLREANVLRTEMIEWPDSEADLVQRLAELASPRPVRRPRPRRKKRSRPSTDLSEADILALFLRHGKSAPEEVVAALTRASSPRPASRRTLHPR